MIIDRKNREATITALIKLQVDRMMDEGWFRSCLNCQSFDESREWCKHWKAKPPAKVIAIGCEEHSDNIPF